MWRGLVFLEWRIGAIDFAENSRGAELKAVMLTAAGAGFDIVGIANVDVDVPFENAGYAVEVHDGSLSERLLRQLGLIRKNI